MNGLLDVSRQTFKENTEDVISYVTDLNSGTPELPPARLADDVAS